MKFKKFWSGTGELNFNSNETVIDIRASSALPEPISTGKAQRSNRFQSDGRLNFFKLHASGGTLNFGIESGNVIVRPDVDIFANSKLPAPISVVTISNIATMSANNIYEAPTTDHELLIDINVDRGPKGEASQHHQSATSLSIAINSNIKRIGDLDVKKVHAQSDAKQYQKTFSSAQHELDKQSPTIPIYHREADYLSRTLEHERRELLKAFIATSSHYMNGEDVTNGAISRYKLPPKMFNGSATGWQDAELLISQMIGCDFNDGVPHRNDTFESFQNGINAAGKRPPIIIPPVEPITPLSPDLIFKTLWDNTGELDFLRIELDALIVMNEIDIYHVASDGTKTAVHPVNASLSFDIDSFVWSFSGQLLGSEHLTLLTHRAVFEIDVNGHHFAFTLREFSKANTFANDAYSFTCVTNSQWLGQPYATLHNGTIDNPISAWQLVAEKFASESFTLERTQTPDWTLAQDSFSYVNKSAIEIALLVAGASGAICQPDNTNDIIHVQPRYKTSPWNWNALTDEECDHVISADYIDTQSSKDNTTPQLNSVLISGETHGVITEAVKYGTAGDVPGTDVLSNLSQDHNVNAELARNIMADSGEQEVLGITVPLLQPDSAFSLMLPGDIVRVNYPDSTITGLCLSNSIPIQSLTDVTQSVSLELNNGYN